jgi:anti-sigma factor RsiW
MSQKCATLRHYYARHYEGGLSDGERLHVERHLRSCAECYEDYQAYVSTCDLLHGLPPVEAPFGFASRVRFALRAESEPVQRNFFPSFQTPSLTYLLPSLGAAALVVAASVFMMIHYVSWDRGAPSPSHDSPSASARPDEPMAPRVAPARAEAPPPAAHASLLADQAAMESTREVEEVEALIEDINALASQIRSEPIFLGGDDAHELVFDPYAIYHRPAEPVEAAAAAYSP